MVLLFRSCKRSKEGLIAFPIGPLYQAPNTTVGWSFWVEASAFTVIHFIGLSCPAYGTTVTWGANGISRWYSIESNGATLQWFSMAVTKTGGGSDDFFWGHFHLF